MMIKYFITFAATIFIISCGNSNSQGGANTTGVKENTTGIDGEQLFKVHCMQCHLPDKKFVGPPLAGVEKKWKNKQLLYEFVRNSSEVIKRDKYAADLYEQWQEAPMLPFPDLTDPEIEAILDYCNTFSETK